VTEPRLRRGFLFDDRRESNSIREPVSQAAIRILHRFHQELRIDVKRLQLEQEPCSGVVMLGTVLLVILILILIGSLPTWPYSGSWGYYPSGGFGLVVVIVIVLLLMGRI
jgi:hypothetical protein